MADEQALAVLTEIQRLRTLGLDLTQTAVIARQWKYLDPLRAACESLGIPVNMADEEEPPLWRLRETQALLGHAAAHGQLVKAERLLDWFAGCVSNDWIACLKHAVAVFAEDTHGTEVSLDYFRDWLAEWGRASRHKQNGLLLLSAHRAKGLEFDHVIVLDGDWRPQDGEDTDAVRRLYYVAMTRARQTLTLARMDGGNFLIDQLPVTPALLYRPPTQWPPAPPGMNRRYLIPSLRDIDLGFAGRKPPAAAVHREIAALQVGDELQLLGNELRTLDGFCVGRLSSKFDFPSDLRCVRASVRAIVVWRQRDSDPEYQHFCKCGHWEVVLPELVYAP
jgi:ATP-dependent DNA helicase RecQ